MVTNVDALDIVRKGTVLHFPERSVHLFNRENTLTSGSGPPVYNVPISMLVDQAKTIETEADASK